MSNHHLFFGRRKDMKYCIKYTTALNNTFLNKMDEFFVDFDKTDTTLPDFLEKYSDKTIGLFVAEYGDIKSLIPITEKYKNVKIVLPHPKGNKSAITTLREKKIPYFFDFISTNWDDFNSIVKSRPSDIIVAGEICFDMKALADIAQFYGAKLKVIPHIAQGGFNEGITKFFINPKDIDLYEPYVDTMVLNPFVYRDDMQKIEIIYDVYANKKEWFGDLSEIIYNLNTPIDNRALTDMFTKSRLNCGKRCFKGKYCSVCPNALSLADIIRKEKMILQADKK